MKFEQIIPKELNYMPGFYEVPGSYPAAISKDGKIFSMHTKKMLTTRIGTYGYILVSVNCNGVEKNYRVHRLLALTFIGRPMHLWGIDFDKLVVNHNDGNKSNNSLDNLEWCTDQENSHHAIHTGLRNTDVILAKDLISNRIKEYTDSYACARAFGIKEGTLRLHVLSKDAGTKQKDFHVFKLDNGTPWPEVSNIDLTKNYNDFLGRGYWIARNIKTNKSIIANTLQDICELLNLKYASVDHLYKKDNLDNDCFGWNIQYRERMTETELKSLPAKTATNNGGVKVKLMNIKTNEETIYDSKNKMSIATGIGLGTISYYMNRDLVLNDTYKFVIV